MGAQGHDRINASNNPVNLIDPLGLETGQSGMGPLSGNDRDIVKAREIANKQGSKQAQDYLDDVIKNQREKLKDLKGKDRQRLLRRINQLKGARKVIPRYFPVTPSPAMYPLIFCLPCIEQVIIEMTPGFGGCPDA